MGPINVTVTDANNVILEVTPTPTTVVEIDRGVAGNGIVSIVPVTISTLQYLRITYTNGTVSDVGPLTSTAYFGQSPISIVGNTISLTTVPIQLGGTGQTTANDSFNALAPSQTGNSGRYLTTDGTNTSWAVNPLGTVTSVSGTGTVNGLTLTGTVTTSGSLTLGGTLDLSSPPTIGNTTPNTGAFTTLTTSSTVTLNGGTANGVAYLNGSKVLTTGSALTFDGSKLTVTSSGEQIKLTSSGDFSSTGTGYLRFYDSVGAKGFVGYGGTASRFDINTGPSMNLNMNAVGGTMTFQISNTEQMRLTSTGLGIGTSSPVGNLDVAGTTPTLNIRDTQSKVSWAAGDIVATLDFYSNDTSGVGAQAVSRIRSVADTASAATSGALAFWTAAAGAAATEKLRITSAGNVGIGTSSPGTKLDVQGSVPFARVKDNSTGYLGFRAENNSGNFYFGIDSSTGGFYGSAYARVLYSDGAYPMVFYTNATERMRLDSSGNLGIGTSSPGYKLDVNGYGRFSSGVLGSGGLTVYGDASSGSGMLLTTAGNLGIGTSSPGYKLTVAGTGGSATVSLLETGVRSWGIRAGGAATGTFDIADFTAGATRLTLDSSGNLGLGVTPSAWGAFTRALQMGDYAALNSDTGNGAANVSMNAFFNGTNWIYRNSSWPASYYNQSNGLHRWYIAPSGTAGNAISFTQAMTLDASGNLAIGATTAGHSLDIRKPNSSLRVGHDTNGLGALLSWSNTSGEARLWSLGAYPLILGTDGTERARITSSGNFLLGTTGNGSPGLGVANSFNISFPESTDGTSLATMFRQSSSGDLVLGSGVRYSATANAFASSTGDAWARTAINVGYGAIKFFTAAEATASVGTNTTLTERARIDSSGNLLVGTTTASPATGGIGSITIGGSNANVSGSLAFQRNGYVDAYLYRDTDGLFFFQSLASGGVKWSSGSSTERMRINTSGDLLVGTTSSAAKITALCGNSASALATTNTSGTGLYYAAIFHNNGTSYTTVGSISVSGSATSYNTSSDYRLKNTIAPMTGALAKVALLKPCTYKWNADGSDGEGFIAHELAEVVPQCVTGEKDAVDAEGKPQYQGIDTSFLVATLTAALQELNAKFDAYVATHP